MADGINMAATARIRHSIEDAMAALEQLAQLLADECRLLGHRAPPEQMERLARDKRDVVAALEQIDVARQHTLREAGCDSPMQGMKQFLQLAQAPELAALWQGFLAKLREVRALNEANGLAIRRSQALVGAELKVLRGESPEAGGALYDAAGGCGYAARGRIISSA